NFVSVAVSFCPLSEKREHQFLDFNKAYGEVVQTQFTKSRLRFGYQLRLPEVPGDAVKGQTHVQPVAAIALSPGGSGAMLAANLPSALYGFPAQLAVIVAMGAV